MASRWKRVWSPPLRRKRRRNRAAVIVLVVILVALIGGAIYAARDAAIVTAAAFSRARNNPTDLRAFLYPMPKGGDLHVHLSGGVSAERYIAWAIADRLCVQLSDYSLVKTTCDKSAGTVPIDDVVGAADTPAKQQVYDRIVDALSMRNFAPTLAEPTGHDHFFDAFGKFSAASGPHFTDMIVDQLQYYQGQSAQYVELMTSFSGWTERQDFDKAIAGKSDFKSKLDALRQAGLAAFVEKKKADLAEAVAEVEKKLGCDGARTRPGCAVVYRFIAQVSRNSTLDDVFVQTAIAAALVRIDPLVVGFNYVQAEDAMIPRRDYSEHMRIAGFLAHDPSGGRPVHVTLHAGELWLGLVPPQDLTFHIDEAVRVAGAERIGHGVDLAFERDEPALLAEMRRRHVAVEINLTSNDQILGVHGAAHPFPAYLAADVPVALSTDDAGVERTDLTNEYVRAARDYGLGYAELKALARASLAYSFLDPTHKKDELRRFDDASAAFERSVMARGTFLQNLGRVVTTIPAWL